MKIQWLPFIIALMCVFNMVVHWEHTQTMLAWLVALSGWLAHAFVRKDDHGNS